MSDLISLCLKNLPLLKPAKQSWGWKAAKLGLKFAPSAAEGR